jgi:hypothetical protein
VRPSPAAPLAAPAAPFTAGPAAVLQAAAPPPGPSAALLPSPELLPLLLPVLLPVLLPMLLSVFCCLRASTAARLPQTASMEHTQLPTVASSLLWLRAISLPPSDSSAALCKTAG